MPKVIVIGGGYSGISGAVNLREAGFDVLMLEAGQFLGGRHRPTKFKNSDKTEFDNGTHLLSGAYTETLELLRKLGVGNMTAGDPHLRVPFREAGRSFTFDTGKYPGKLGDIAALKNIEGLSMKSRLGIAKLVSKIRKDKTDYSGMTCMELAGYFKQTREAYTRFWKPIIVSALNTDPSVASAELFVEVANRGLFGSKGQTALLHLNCSVFEYMNKIEESLKDYVTDIKHEKVISVKEHGSHIKVKTSAGNEYRTEYVFAALNFPQFIRLFSDYTGLFEDFLELKFSPIISATLFFDREILDDKFAAMIGTTAEWIFDKNKMTKRNEKDYRYDITVSAADKLLTRNNRILIEQFIKDIESVLPQAKNAKLKQYQITKEKYATPVFSPEMNRLRPLPGRYGNIFIAGDWTATGLPATIESAVLSGKMAVAEPL